MENDPVRRRGCAPSGREAWDATSNRTAPVNALGNRTTYGYDRLNRQTTLTDSGGGVATAVYDAVGNRVNDIDPVGNKTTHVYDKLNRETKTIDALGGVTTQVFDAVGHVVNLIDPVGNKTTFVWDALNRQTQEIDPFGHALTYAYDAASRLSSQTDRLGRRRDYTYDNDNRVLTDTWKAAGGATDNVLTYTWDANGNALTAAAYSGAYTLTYDALNRATVEAEPFGLTLTNTYDAVGKRTKIEDSKGGITSYTFDAVNRTTKVEFGGASQTPLRFDLAYTDRNELKGLTRYSDLAGSTKIGSTSYTYNSVGRTTNILHKDGSGTAIGNYTYTYDLASRATSEIADGTTTSYGYDATSQLTSAGASNYGFDAAGNRNATGYQTDAANPMTNDGTWTYTYDAEGERTKKSKGASLETWTFGYDQRGQMTWAEQRSTDGGTLQLRLDFKYDAFGSRIQEDRWTNASGTITTEYGFDGANVWVDLDGGSSLTTRYVRLPWQEAPLARINAAGTAGHYGLDRLGSVRLNIDAAGSVANSTAYDAWGKIVSQTNASAADGNAFTGEVVQIDVGLQWQRKRWYDPATGRWTSEDPIRWGARDYNLDRYIFNNAPNGTDPTGEHLFTEGADTIPVLSQLAQHGIRATAWNVDFDNRYVQYIHIELEDYDKARGFFGSLSNGAELIQAALSEQSSYTTRIVDQEWHAEVYQMNAREKNSFAHAHQQAIGKTYSGPAGRGGDNRDIIDIAYGWEKQFLVGARDGVVETAKVLGDTAKAVVEVGFADLSTGQSPFHFDYDSNLYNNYFQQASQGNQTQAWLNVQEAYWKNSWNFGAVTVVETAITNPEQLPYVLGNVTGSNAAGYGIVKGGSLLPAGIKYLVGKPGKGSPTLVGPQEPVLVKPTPAEGPLGPLGAPATTPAAATPPALAPTPAGPAVPATPPAAPVPVRPFSASGGSAANSSPTLLRPGGNSATPAAAPATGEIPPVIYREGTTSPSNLKTDPQGLSFRDSLSNPIQPGTPGPLPSPSGAQRPVLRPGKDYIGVDTSKLPPGSVIPDGVPGSLVTPPGHVSVVNVPYEVLRNAVIDKPPTPPYGPGASGKLPK